MANKHIADQGAIVKARLSGLIAEIEDCQFKSDKEAIEKYNSWGAEIESIKALAQDKIWESENVKLLRDQYVEAIRGKAAKGKRSGVWPAIAIVLVVVFLIIVIKLPDKNNPPSDKKGDFMTFYDGVLTDIDPSIQSLHVATVGTSDVPLWNDAYEKQKTCSAKFSGSYPIPESLSKYKTDIQTSILQIKNACDIQQDIANNASKFYATYATHPEYSNRMKQAMDLKPLDITKDAISRLTYDIGVNVGADRDDLNAKWMAVRYKGQ